MKLSVYDWRNIQKPFLELSHDGYVFSCAMSSSGRYVAGGIGNPDYKVFIWLLQNC